MTITKLYLLFTKPDSSKYKGKIVCEVMGDVGSPMPEEKETALIFLNKHRKEGHFTAAVGAFGYFKLKMESKEDHVVLRKKIGQYRECCKKIKDEKLRRSMDRYYQKTLNLAKKKAKKNEKN